MKLDDCIKEIVSDEQKIKLLTYMFYVNVKDVGVKRERVTSASSVIQQVKTDEDYLEILRFFENCNLIVKRGKKFNLTHEGRSIAWGLIQYFKFSEGVFNLDNISNEGTMREKSIILDIGCGAGQLLMYASKYNPKLMVGVDIDKPITILARYLSIKHDLNSTFLLARIQKLPFKENSFDYIICRSVIYLTKNGTLVREISKTLKEEGKIYIGSVPAYGSPVFRIWASKNIKSLIIAFFSLFNGIFFHLTGKQLSIRLPFSERCSLCQTFYTLSRMKKLLKKNNLSLLDIKINREKKFKLNIPTAFEVFATKV